MQIHPIATRNPSTTKCLTNPIDIVLVRPNKIRDDAALLGEFRTGLGVEIVEFGRAAFLTRVVIGQGWIARDAAGGSFGGSISCCGSAMLGAAVAILVFEPFVRACTCAKSLAIRVGHVGG